MRILAVLLLSLLALSGCQPVPPAEGPGLAFSEPPDLARYGSFKDGPHTVRAIDLETFPAGYLRQRVRYVTDEAPGTIIIDSANRYLYFIEGNGAATRYGVAIGREGFGWTGEGYIARRAKWPRWTPPPEMIQRQPYLAKYADGMPGGADNPLGARALYVYQNGRDTLIRVHGTNEPKSIGWSASSGCFRMLNQDVIELFNRVPDGAKVIVF